MSSEQGITPNERATVLALGEAWNLYLRLDGRDYEMDRDFRQAIHRAQDIIAYRVASRIDPDVWKQLSPNTDLEDQRDDPEYQAFALEVAETCSADDRPCDSCLAGGICDGPSRTDDYFDEDEQ